MHFERMRVLSTARTAVPSPLRVRQVEPLKFLVELSASI